MKKQMKNSTLTSEEKQAAPVQELNDYHLDLELDQENLLLALRLLSEGGVDFKIKKVEPVTWVGTIKWSEYFPQYTEVPLHAMKDPPDNTGVPPQYPFGTTTGGFGVKFTYEEPNSTTRVGVSATEDKVWEKECTSTLDYPPRGCTNCGQKLGEGSEEEGPLKDTGYKPIPRGPFSKPKRVARY